MSDNKVKVVEKTSDFIRYEYYPDDDQRKTANVFREITQHCGICGKNCDYENVKIEEVFDPKKIVEKHIASGVNGFREELFVFKLTYPCGHTAKIDFDFGLMPMY